jgi:hypothetical protein
MPAAAAPQMGGPGAQRGLGTEGGSRPEAKATVVIGGNVARPCWLPSLGLTGPLGDCANRIDAPRLSSRRAMGTDAAPVAQSDRASDFESEGRGFDSLRARSLGSPRPLFPNETPLR